MQADYLELCMIMYVSAGVDAHTQVASEAFGVLMAEVSPERRGYAMCRNFARCYGSPRWTSIKSVTHPGRGSFFLTQSEAARVTEDYFNEYPWMRDFFAQYPPGSRIP